MVAVAGGKDIRGATYAIYGSRELSDNAIAALEGHTACPPGHRMPPKANKFVNLINFPVYLDRNCAEY